MSLSCSQYSLLYFTNRKSTLEFNMSMNSMKKMNLAKEMSELSKEYNTKLNAKHITFYANGKYNPVNYQYLMGYGANFSPISNGNLPLKENNSMILTDYLGRVVMGDSYANAIKDVLGASIIDSNGQGSTFSTSDIPQIMARLLSGTTFLNADVIEHVHNGGKLDGNYNAVVVNTLTMDETGENTTVDYSEEITQNVKRIVDFYYPIFAAAAANGWTTEYNQQMAEQEYYIDDAITSGLFQLASVSNSGQYEEGTSMTYFFMNGDLDQRSDADKREEVTAWYNAMKDDIALKEQALDIELQRWSTELEVINTQIESVQSLLDDSMKAFEWNGVA